MFEVNNKITKTISTSFHGQRFCSGQSVEILIAPSQKRFSFFGIIKGSGKRVQEETEGSYKLL